MPVDPLCPAKRGIPSQVLTSGLEASQAVAREIADLIRLRESDGQTCVLGLATGSTPLDVYAELIRMHREEGLSFRNVVTFNLDEYYPMQPTAAQSYVRFMNEQLFDHIDIPAENVHIPDGTISLDDVAAYCDGYEQKIAARGGLDLQLLGIGRAGHIGFNEPGSTLDSRTRLVTLNDVTREDAASAYSGIENVPRQAITMGVGTIMQARRIILLAFGSSKASIVARATEGTVSESVPATFLHHHSNVEFWLDETSAAQLSLS
ncbi:glucosamine-6-phosphate deaminase [Aporhodopirellula aestuarii]|uniref:Glucosamine-6-phosphate deaminase n=1 Tax=Aporhodopirellula aestuarii TaxID=2950107 RepID=A0ABT0UDD9_9BACT|nr:glucosamine-6-phosphate deaminase [Aporhodopirellula aestuarii]MCM2374306.1 glucosamine-6-phosphate deaminase [Aporhodopirellula aestuarii]